MNKDFEILKYGKSYRVETKNKEVINMLTRLGCIPTGSGEFILPVNGLELLKNYIKNNEGEK